MKSRGSPQAGWRNPDTGPFRAIASLEVTIE
jgi:hypothetical protein